MDVNAGGSIKTQVDDLLTSLKNSKGAAKSVKELSLLSGLSVSEVKKWLAILEKNGQVKIENRLSGIYASWIEPAKSSLPVEGAVDVGILPNKEEYSKKDSDIFALARERETYARTLIEKTKPEHSQILKQTDADLADLEKKIEKINEMLVDMQKRKKSLPEKEIEQEKKSTPTSLEKQEDKKSKEADKSLPSVSIPSMRKETREIKQKSETQMQEEESLIQISMPPVLPRRKKSKIEKIKAPAQIQPTSASIQFSEKLARHMRKIILQTQEIEKLKMEKEKLLNEHYIPMQRKLEVELETISDRVLRIEKSILSMHQRAAELPSKVGNIEQLNLSIIKAHAEMKKAFDEASALIDEANRALAEEREKMQVLLEQARQEISVHNSKTQELESMLYKISQMESEAEKMVVSARAALAEQAERLASAEASAKELSLLKDEIKENLDSMRREINTAKNTLSSLEKQMQQMHQIEAWADSIRKDYEQKMIEIDSYIRSGNQEFETLRESVEANFVRRYLRELRQLTDSYTFEFNQVKSIESNIDQRIAQEKKKLEELLEEGRKISYLYELQSKEVAGGEKFEERAKTFNSLSDLAAQRSQLEQMIAQVIGKKTEYEVEKPKIASKEKAIYKSSYKSSSKKSGRKTASKAMLWHLRHKSSK